MSLQDQLLKAGLVDSKKAQKIKKAKHKQAKQMRQKTVGCADEAKQEAQKAYADKIARDRLLNQQRTADAERKATRAQVHQLIAINRQPRDDAEIDYSFTDGTLVKRILVTDTQLKQLSLGNLCIIKLDEEYEIIPVSIAEKIHQRDEGVRILTNQSSETTEVDDFYADYKVPDDLMW